jgi:DNA-binding NarL/FixJ family response regulator
VKAGLFVYQDDFEVVGEASDAHTALAQVAALHPDLVLMDIDMPGADGIAATRRLKTEFPEVTVSCSPSASRNPRSATN